MIDANAFFCAVMTGLVALFVGLIVGSMTEQNSNYTRCLEMGYTVPVCEEMVRGR